MVVNLWYSTLLCVQKRWWSRTWQRPRCRYHWRWWLLRLRCTFCQLLWYHQTLLVDGKVFVFLWIYQKWKISHVWSFWLLPSFNWNCTDDILLESRQYYYKSNHEPRTGYPVIIPLSLSTCMYQPTLHPQSPLWLLEFLQTGTLAFKEMWMINLMDTPIPWNVWSHLLAWYASDICFI